VGTPSVCDIGELGE
jgi:catechol 2,3-dioxygenase-like lactoylglutathione lyase family enzyme